MADAADVAAGDGEDALQVVAAAVVAADADAADYVHGHGDGRPCYFVVDVPCDSNRRPF